MSRLAGVALTIVLTAFSASAGAAAGPRIVGGQKADWHSYPYYANIDDGLCSGALIAVDRVMTAAHCLDNVVVGSVVSLDNGRVLRRVIHLSQHPKLTKATNGAIEFAPHPYDGAVLALDQPVTDIAPLRLATVDDASLYGPGTVVTTMGTGSSSYSGGGDGPFRTAQVQIRDDNDCTAMIRKERRASLWKPLQMICTTDPDGQAPWASACYGDSGSPLVAPTPDGSVVEVGMDSWGAKCGEDNGGPEEYTDVAQVSAFALDPNIIWRPEYAGGLTLTGTAKVGRTLHCSPPKYKSPKPPTIERGFAYSHKDGLYGYFYIKGTSLTLTRHFRGHAIRCYTYGLNGGGPVLDFGSRKVVVR